MPFLERDRGPRGTHTGKRPADFLTRFTPWTYAWWPPLWGAVVLAAAAAGASWAGPALPGWAWGIRAAGLLPAVLPVCGPRGRAWAWLGVALLAAWWGHGEAATRHARIEAVAASAVAPAVNVAWEGILAVRATGYATATGERGWRSPAVVLAVGPGSGAVTPERGEGVWLSGEGPAPVPGGVRRALIRLKVPPRAGIPGGFDLRQYLAGRGLRWRGRELAASPDTAGCAGLARWGGRVDRARVRAAATLTRLLPPREARLGGAVLLGQRTAESRREAADFTSLGLAHLFAVSGLHVGILAGLVFAPLAAAGLGRGTRLAVAVPAVAGFVMLTGAPGSVVRAGSLVVAAAAVPVCGRRPRGLRLLGLVFWCVALWQPAALLDTGVRLSYLAAGGIVLASGATSGFGEGGRVPRVVAAGLGVTLAAQWATLPVIAQAFGRFNLWSPLVNVLVVPVFGAAVWLMAAGLVAASAWTWLGEALAALAWALVRTLEACAAVAAPATGGAECGLPVPGAAQVAVWVVLSLVMVGALRARWPLAVRCAVIGACWGTGLAVFAATGRTLPPRHGPVALQFAVDQGDCAAIAFPDGWLAIVDTGGAWRGGDGPLARGVLPWLRRQGVARVDAVILTHGHRDHTGGAAALAAALEVGRWYGGGRAGEAVATGATAWARPGAPQRTLHSWREWSLVLVDPSGLASSPDGADENDRSLALVLRRDRRAVMVWTGDLEKPGEHTLLQAGTVPSDVDVWKAGHHGSDTSGSPEFLATLRPRTVLISCGVENRYGHPNHGPYLVDGDTVPVLRTDLHGTLVVDWTERGSRPRPWSGAPP